MTNYYKQGSFAWAGGGKAGAIIDLWAVSRFGGVVPAEGAAPPSGTPDAGPVVTGVDAGNPGGYLIDNIATIEDYYVRAQYGGTSYWGGCPAGSIGGQGSGGGGGGGVPFIVNEVQYGPSTVVSYTPTTALAVLDATNLTVSFVVPTGGAVRVTASLFAEASVNNTNAQVTLAFVEHGTTTLATPRENVLGTDFVASEEYFVIGRVNYDSGLITGLTPGATLTWDLAAQLAQNGTGYFTVDDGLTGSNNYGPALITVYNPAGTGGGGGGGGAVSSVSNEDGSLIISPVTGGVIASLANPLPGPVNIEIPTSTSSQAEGLTIRYNNVNSLGSAIATFDYIGDPIFETGPTGGLKVYGDRIQAGIGVFGPFLALDGTTNPPSILWPSSVYGAGARWWSGPGQPTNATYGVQSDSQYPPSVGDLWWDSADKIWYQCTVSANPGTWVQSNFGSANVPANLQTASYTAQLSDEGGVIEMNSGSATTLTIPPNVFAASNTFEVCQVGAGPVTIGSVSGTPSVTHVSDVESSGSPLSSLTIAPAAVGNAVLFSIRIGSTTVTGTPTGGGCTWTQIGSPVIGTDTAVTTQTWLGVCTTTGTSTVTVTWTGTIGTDFTVLGAHEFSSGLGAGTTWTLDGSAVTVNTTSTSTAVTFPSVTAAGSNELYYSEIYTTQTTPAGSSAGFTYYGGGSKDLAVWNLAATGTLAPTATQSSTGFYSGIGFCLIATNPTVTIDAPGGANVLNEQWSSATVRFRSGTECVLAGDLTT